MAEYRWPPEPPLSGSLWVEGAPGSLVSLAAADSAARAGAGRDDDVEKGIYGGAGGNH